MKRMTQTSDAHSRPGRVRGYVDPVRDTTTAAEHVRLAAIRGMTPGERLRQVLDVSEAARELGLSGFRVRHPNRSDLELVELLLGTRLVPSAARPSGT